MNAWEQNFMVSIKAQQAKGRTLSDKQQACLDKINTKYGTCEEKELSHKQRYGRCEDAPCCGCCGQDAYGGYDSYTGNYDY